MKDVPPDPESRTTPGTPIVRETALPHSRPPPPVATIVLNMPAIGQATRQLYDATPPPHPLGVRWDASSLGRRGLPCSHPSSGTHRQFSSAPCRPPLALCTPPRPLVPPLSHWPRRFRQLLHTSNTFFKNCRRPSARCFPAAPATPFAPSPGLFAQRPAHLLSRSHPP
jgi:hypothetical protein